MVASPDTIDSVVRTYHRAAELNRTCALRQGNVVVLHAEHGDDVMIAADLHGHRRNFARLLKAADLAAHPRRHLIMQEVCHGGPLYPGGGCMSHLMLEDIARLKAEFGDRFHYLLSNHELAELTDFPITKGRRVLNLSFRCGLQEMYGDHDAEIRAAMTAFIASLPLAVRTPSAFICHSLPEAIDQQGFDAAVFQRRIEPDDLTTHGAVFDLVWGRDFRPANAEAFCKLIDAPLLIHGHEPCPDGFATPNARQVIIDCCNDKACYVLLPLDQQLTQQELVERIQRLA
jgi:hypothetical protein